MKTHLALVGVLLLAACQSSTAPDDCPEIRARVAALREQAVTLETIAQPLRRMLNAADTYRALMTSAASSRQTAAAIAQSVPRCAPYEVTP